MNARAIAILAIALLLTPTLAFPQAKNADGKQIEIGVIASWYSATRAPGRVGFGYKHATRMFSAFQDRRVESDRYWWPRNPNRDADVRERFGC